MLGCYIYHPARRGQQPACVCPGHAGNSYLGLAQSATAGHCSGQGVVRKRPAAIHRPNARSQPVACPDQPEGTRTTSGPPDPFSRNKASLQQSLRPQTPGFGKPDRHHRPVQGEACVRFSRHTPGRPHRRYRARCKPARSVLRPPQRPRRSSSSEAGFFPHSRCPARWR